jgi:hypothetical protein
MSELNVIDNELKAIKERILLKERILFRNQSRSVQRPLKMSLIELKERFITLSQFKAKHF